jgi:hypothetical protein
MWSKPTGFRWNGLHNYINFMFPLSVHHLFMSCFSLLEHITVSASCTFRQRIESGIFMCAVIIFIGTRNGLDREVHSITQMNQISFKLQIESDLSLVQKLQTPILCCPVTDCFGICLYACDSRTTVEWCPDLTYKLQYWRDSPDESWMNRPCSV